VALRLEDAARNAVAACEPEDGLRVARRRRRIVAWGAVGALLFAIAFLAVVGPEFEQRRMRRREHCAIEWITDLYSAQSQYHASEHSNPDADAIGRFGLFSEVAGCLREPKHGLQYRNCICRSTDLRRAFAQVEQGRVRLNGYIYELWLPAKGGGFVNERDVANGRELDEEKCQTTWICYAWPETAGSSGRQVLVCGSSGDIRVFYNKDGRYSGDSSPVIGVAGFVSREPGAELVAHGEDCLGDF
jgi:hypothetical protein